MNSKINIIVLLPTFNSADFVRLQIYSIFSQKNVDITLYTMDDKSSDNTVEIVRELSKYLNIIQLEAPRKFGKAASSFLYMINYLATINLSYDYVALSDHDDIWNESKIYCAVEELRNNKASGYSSSVQSIKIDKHGYGVSSYVDKSKNPRLYDYFFESPGPGCTFVLDNFLINILNEYLMKFPSLIEKIWGHDWLIYAIARSNNLNWFIDSRCFILYLQRDSNETGVNLGWKAFVKRFRALKSGWFLAQSLYISEVVTPNSIICKRLKRLNLIDKFWFFINFRKLRRNFFHSIVLVVSIILFGRANIEDFESGGKL